jgi:Na+/H+-dicarboxylate symporter/ABC-type amino acid transport substrate-binding protein
MNVGPSSPPGARRFLWRIVAGLIAGAATGLFLGDRAQVFQTAADGFVKLLQMAVLPYITVSIIGSIGGLDVTEIRRLGTRTALVLPALWGLALVFAFLTPLTFPAAESASFFSTTMVERPPAFSFVDLYIPANPFFALANNIVPAVVLFSMVVGVALIGLPRKQVLLDVLETAGQALARAMGFVVRLTPYGVFAIAATTAGTLRIEQAARLEVYLIAYMVLALVLALWALPGLVSALTPIPVREIVGTTREAVLTAAIAGDLFIVLPALIAACKGLAARYNPGAPHAAAMPDVIVPVSYNFPHSGKLLSVSFVLFAGWFSDATIDPADYPRLAVTSIVTLFGSITAAMPFLLDVFRVPADTFQLFVASGVLNSRFGTLVAAMHTVAMALLGTCAVSGTLRWQPAALVRYAVITVALTASAVGGTRLVAEQMLATPFAGADVLAAMTVEPEGDAAVFSRLTPPREPPPPAGERLETIIRRRVVRVGYLSDALPYAFFNGRDSLVGLDVALMHHLAIELGGRLEFVPIGRDHLDRPSGAPELLRSGACDIIVGGLAVTTARAGLMQLSSSYLEETLAFVVRDGDRRRFESWDAIRASGPITLAVPPVPYYADRLRTRLPDARLRTVETIDGVFHLPAGWADAFAIPAERGSAWTLRYPQYSVVVPAPGPIRVPLAVALPRGEPDLATFIDTWIDLKRRDGTIDELYRYWILGRGRKATEPRWSIIRNVLHWVE